MRELVVMLPTLVFIVIVRGRIRKRSLIKLRGLVRVWAEYAMPALVSVILRFIVRAAVSRMIIRAKRILTGIPRHI
jgi:hypothetical protein